MFDIEDLMTVTFNDNDIPKFLRDWNYVINGLSEVVPDTHLERILWKKIKNSKNLAHDVNHYQRIKPNHEDKCYAFSIECV